MDVSFNKIRNFKEYDLNYDMIAENTSAIIQVLATSLYFMVLSGIAMKLKGNCRIFSWFKRRFIKRRYNNMVQLLLGVHVTMCFGCSVTLQDRQLNSLYKMANYAFSLVLLFASTMAVVIHPVFLRALKKSIRKETDDSYCKASRKHNNAEYYVFSGLSTRICVTAGIALLPSHLALIVIALSALN